MLLASRLILIVGIRLLCRRLPSLWKEGHSLSRHFELEDNGLRAPPSTLRLSLLFRSTWSTHEGSNFMQDNIHNREPSEPPCRSKVHNLLHFHPALRGTSNLCSSLKPAITTRNDSARFLLTIDTLWLRPNPAPKRLRSSLLSKAACLNARWECASCS